MEESAAQASRPIDEMRGGCAQYALDIREELAAMKEMPRRVTSLTERGVIPPIGPSRQPLSVTLHHSGSVALTTVPRREGPNAGLIPVVIPEDGRYRVSADSAIWIEVVRGSVRVEPVRFEMQTGCAALFKVVEYQLPQGVDYWIELSGNTSMVTILLSPEAK